MSEENIITQKYAKLISEREVEIAPQNNEEKGISNYNQDINMMLEDGYLPLYEVEAPVTERWYELRYNQESAKIQQYVYWLETEEQYEERINQINKQQKIQELNKKINELKSMLINELRLNNIQNIEIYNEVIKGLEETRDNL